MALMAICLLSVLAWGLIVPRLVRRDVRQRLERYWGGVVEFGNTSFSLRGPIVIHDVALKDEAGRTWATTPALVAEISHWQWLDPQITALRASQTEVTVHLDAAPPLQQPTSTDEPAWPFLTLIDVEMSRVAFLQDGRPAGEIGPSQLFANWRDDGSDIWDATLKGLPPDVPVNLQMAVDLDDINGEELLAANIVGDLAGGQLTGTVRTRRSAGRPLEVWGSLLADDVMLADLPMVAASDVGRGYLILGQGVFHIDEPSLSGLTGRGSVLVKDLPAEGIPVLTEIAILVGPESHLEQTDLAMTFTLDGETLTVEQGKIGGVVLAVSIEPASTANILTGELDMTTTAATLADAHSLAEHLPIVGMLAGISDALTRATVTGTWREPVVTPTPMTSAEDPLLDFFGSVGRSGGRLDAGVLSTLGKLFENGLAADGDDGWPEGCPPPPTQPPMPARPIR